MTGRESDLGLSLVMAQGVYKNSGYDGIERIIRIALTPS